MSAPASLHPGGLALTARALDACALAEGARVLDLGCGPGATLSLLRARGLRPCGVDVSSRALSEARCASPVLAQAGGGELPFKARAFGAVLLECSLCLVRDPAAALRECARVLAPGGWLVISDLYARSGAPAPGPPGCCGGFTSRGELASLLARHGFALRRFEDQSAALAAYVARLLLNPGPAAAGLEEAIGRGRATRGGYFLLVAQLPAAGGV